MTLAFAPFGKELIIVRLIAEDKLKRHLENLGFIPGALLQSLYDNKGDVVVKAGNAKLALGRGVATKIEVKLKEEVC